MDRARAEHLRAGTHEAYSGVAEAPMGEHPFPVGRAFAQSVGYPAELLDSLPDGAVAAFAGVSNVALTAQFDEGETVLDLGCGAGLDSLIAANRLGERGRLLGIDYSQAMLRRAERSAAAAGCRNAWFQLGDAERLPLGRGTIDTAMINGIFNLNPYREAIFAELARVMRPGGKLFAAELILKEPLPPETGNSDIGWFT